tara:strand:+ start:1973 stop:2188 length:216 start_codon:yes stop_codon:yes gene_type:complete
MEEVNKNIGHLVELYNGKLGTSLCRSVVDAIEALSKTNQTLAQVARVIEQQPQGGGRFVEVKPDGPGVSSP